MRQRCTQLRFGLTQNQALLVQLGLGGKVSRQQLFRSLDIHARLIHAAFRSIHFSACGSHLQRFLYRIELKQGLLALDVAADVHQSLDHLAGSPETQLAFMACPYLS